MKSLRIIYHLARADFLERSRSYSFLVVLGLVVFLGYQVAIGNMGVQLGSYRGEYNSAWVGAMMSMMATIFLGWFGFFVVKGSIARDRETGVGQIMATTPISRPLYAIGKWVSNFVVLMAMTAVLALAGLVIQFLKGESAQVDVIAFLDPFIYIVMPLIAFTAAVTVLFETIPFLSGGFGNIVYFFLFVISLTLVDVIDNVSPIMEPLGLSIMQEHMGAELVKVHPDYDGGLRIGVGTGPEGMSGTFVWNGIKWTPDMILARFSFFGIALLVTLLAALFFDRFDPSRSKPRRMKSAALLPTVEVDPAPRALSTPHLTPLNTSANRFSFLRVLVTELKLLLKGQRWWWYAIAAILIFNCFINDTKTVREILLPMAWIWHILLLSPLGNRESHHNVQQMTFSSASPLWRQLPAQWLAGFIVTLLMGSGAALNFIVNGDTTALLSLIAGAIFIPSLALALGIWSGTSKAFEVVYATLWYLGPLNRLAELNFVNSAKPTVFAFYALALIALAIFGRAKQLRN